MTKPQYTGEHENPDIPAKPRHMTIPEVEEKLAVLDAAHEKALNGLEGRLATERRRLLAENTRGRKAAIGELVEAHETKRGTLAAYLAVLKMEATHDQPE